MKWLKIVRIRQYLADFEHFSEEGLLVVGLAVAVIANVAGVGLELLQIGLHHFTLLYKGAEGLRIWGMLLGLGVK